jgi:5-methylcytosine-specific restriction endonuclease McrA
MSRNPIYIKLINSVRWKKLRVQKLKANPVCEECAKRDVSTLATEVHHLTPVESVAGAAAMERLMFNWSNLQSLCHACHAEIHRLIFSHSKESIQKNNKRVTERFIEKFL